MIDSQQAQIARADLSKFVQELYDFLRRTINEPYDRQGKLLVIEEVLPALREAWAHFDEDFSIDRARAAIYEAPAERLQSHGLYGAQLRAKQALVDFRFRRILDGITKRGLGKLIDALDTILDSIIAATGLDGAIKEMKDLLRNSVDDE